MLFQGLIWKSHYSVLSYTKESGTRTKGKYSHALFPSAPSYLVMNTHKKGGTWRKTSSDQNNISKKSILGTSVAMVPQPLKYVWICENTLVSKLSSRLLCHHPRMLHNPALAPPLDWGFHGFISAAGRQSAVTLLWTTWLKCSLCERAAHHGLQGGHKHLCTVNEREANGEAARRPKLRIHRESHSGEKWQFSHQRA